MLTEDGTCSSPTRWRRRPTTSERSWAGDGAGHAAAVTLERLVERVQETTGADWVGVYQRRMNSAGVPVLVKLAYVGRPAARNSRSPRIRGAQHQFHRRPYGPCDGDRGRLEHVEAGGGFYVCDDGVQSEACVPILGDSKRVIGIVDAEAKPRLLRAERLAKVAALAIVADGGIALAAPGAPRTDSCRRFQRRHAFGFSRASRSALFMSSVVRVQARRAHGVLGLGDDDRGVVGHGLVHRALDGILRRVVVEFPAGLHPRGMVAAALGGARLVGGAGAVVSQQRARQVGALARLLADRAVRATFERSRSITAASRSGSKLRRNQAARVKVSWGWTCTRRLQQ